MDGKCGYCNKVISAKKAVSHLEGCPERIKKIKNRENGKAQLTIEITSKRDERYSLIINIDEDATLNNLDKVIRDTWVECCGHLSEFIIDGESFRNVESDDIEVFGMGISLEKTLMEGDVFEYNYDFGETTELEGTVIDRIIVDKKTPQCEIIFRNKKIGEYNSPREGSCGFCGVVDKEKFKMGNREKFNKNEYDLAKWLDSEETDMFNMEEVKVAEEMFKSLFKQLEKKHKKAMKFNEISSLKEIIEGNTVQELKVILKLLKIEYSSKDKKADLVEAYMKNYKKAYKVYLNNITGIAYNSIRTIYENDGNIPGDNNLNCLEVFLKVGFLNYVSTRRGIMIHICKELLPLVKDINFEKVLLNEKILNWGIGLVNTYGAIEFSEFIELVKKYNSENIDFTGAREVFEVETVDSPYILLEDNILRNAKLDIMDAKKITKIKGEFKVIDEKKLFDVFPLINPCSMKEFNSLKRILKNNFEIEDGEVDEEINMIYILYQVLEEDMFNGYLNERYDMAFEYEVGLKKALLEVLDKLPCWKLKGYSVKELRNKKNSIKAKAKTGRNEPCTCGSGKKYKNCCGSNVIKVNFGEK